MTNSQTYFLSVLFSVGDSTARSEAWPKFLEEKGVATVVHIFRVEVAQSLAWVKLHADELAKRCTGSDTYVALSVTCNADGSL